MHQRLFLEYIKRKRALFMCIKRIKKDIGKDNELKFYQNRCFRGFSIHYHNFILKAEQILKMLIEHTTSIQHAKRIN